ncbi:hypothetical protein FAIPA1_130145 [Frankia sp. AiPs1]
MASNRSRRPADNRSNRSARRINCATEQAADLDQCGVYSTGDAGLQ